MNNISCSRIKTIIVDDNKQIRYLVQEILRGEDDIEVCAEAETWQEALRVLDEHKPDVAIFDLVFDSHSETSILEEMAKINLTAKVIILSAHSENYYSAKCLEAGAKGYVSKDKVVSSLADAIRAVHSGDKFVSS